MRAAAGDDQRPGWRDLLRPEDWPLFNALRDWRNERAREEGVPPYVIATNRQLAQVARDRPQTLSQLAQVEGFGKAKVGRHGRAMLQVVGAPAAVDGADGDGAGAGQPPGTAADQSQQTAAHDVQGGGRGEAGDSDRA